MLESPLVCLMLLAVKCPEIKATVCEEILRRLMLLHADDELLCKRCNFYLQRIAFISDHFKENREEEERRDKERDRERAKKQKKNTTSARNTTNGRRVERTDRPIKKEKKEKKSSEKGKGETTLKKAKKAEGRTVRSNKKKEEKAEKTELGVKPILSPVERLSDMSPYLEFSSFFPAETTVPFDHSAPGTSSTLDSMYGR